MTNTIKDVDRAYFGLKLYEARTAKGMTQSELAEILEVSDRIIYDYESGKKIPGPAKLVIIALTLQVSLDSILRLA